MYAQCTGLVLVKMHKNNKDLDHQMVFLLLLDGRHKMVYRCTFICSRNACSNYWGGWCLSKLDNMTLDGRLKYVNPARADR